MGRPPDDSQGFRLRTFYHKRISPPKQASTLNLSKSLYSSEKRKVIGQTTVTFYVRELSFDMINAGFARIYATLPSGFSASYLPHNVAKHQSRPEQRLETPFSPGDENSAAILLGRK
jgi:hypothetical protein